MSDAQPSQQKPSYKDSLNLPKTAFAMKANLSQSEPATLARWETMGLYDRLERERDAHLPAARERADVAVHHLLAEAQSRQHLASAGAADAVDVREGDLEPLVAREVDAYQTCHEDNLRLVAGSSAAPFPSMMGLRPATGGGVLAGARGRVPPWEVQLWSCWWCWSCSAVLALPLLVARVLADDHDPPMPTDHLALVADGLDAWIYLHRSLHGVVPGANARA